MSHLNAGKQDRRNSAPISGKNYMNSATEMLAGAFKRDRQDDVDERPRKLQRNHSDQLRQLRGERGSLGVGRRQRQNRSKFLEENSKKWLMWNVQMRPACCPNVHRVTTGTVVRALEPEPVPAAKQSAAPENINKMLAMFDESDDE